MNELEQFMVNQPVLPECPVEHRFTPGLYSRTIYMGAGRLVASKIHRTEHQFVVSQGRLKVWTEQAGWVEMQAPIVGITKPGTRRALLILEDTVWTTFHPTPLTNVAEIEAEIIEPHDLPPRSVSL